MKGDAGGGRSERVAQTSRFDEAVPTMASHSLRRGDDQDRKAGRAAGKIHTRQRTKRSELEKCAMEGEEQEEQEEQEEELHEERGG